jgi:hypothetical protein
MDAAPPLTLADLVDDVWPAHLLPLLPSPDWQCLACVSRHYRRLVDQCVRAAWRRTLHAAEAPVVDACMTYETAQHYAFFSWARALPLGLSILAWQRDEQQPAATPLRSPSWVYKVAAHAQPAQVTWLLDQGLFPRRIGAQRGQVNELLSGLRAYYRRCANNTDPEAEAGRLCALFGVTALTALPGHTFKELLMDILIPTGCLGMLRPLTAFLQEKARPLPPAPPPVEVYYSNVDRNGRHARLLSRMTADTFDFYAPATNWTMDEREQVDCWQQALLNGHVAVLHWLLTEVWPMSTPRDLFIGRTSAAHTIFQLVRTCDSATLEAVLDLFAPVTPDAFRAAICHSAIMADNAALMPLCVARLGLVTVRAQVQAWDDNIARDVVSGARRPRACIQWLCDL